MHRLTLDSSEEIPMLKAPVSYMETDGRHTTKHKTAKLLASSKQTSIIPYMV